MYQFVDQPVGRLGHGSRFVLWAMRAWTNAVRRDLCPRAMIGGAFVNLGAAAALPDFDAAMIRLRQADAGLHPAPLAGKRIVEDEAVLLALWQDVAAGRHDRALGVLRLLVPAATADLLGEAFAGATDHFRHAGLAPLGLAAPLNQNIDPAANIGGAE